MVNLNVPINQSQMHLLDLREYQRVDLSIIFTGFKFPAENMVEDTKSLVTENQEFQYRDETFGKKIFGTSNCQYTNAIKTHKNFHLECFCQQKKLDCYPESKNGARSSG